MVFFLQNQRTEGQNRFCLEEEERGDTGIGGVRWHK
jgi:hypothetical protein